MEGCLTTALSAHVKENSVNPLLASDYFLQPGGLLHCTSVSCKQGGSLKSTSLCNRTGPAGSETAACFIPGDIFKDIKTTKLLKNVTIPLVHGLQQNKYYVSLFSTLRPVTHGPQNKKGIQTDRRQGQCKHLSILIYSVMNYQSNSTEQRSSWESDSCSASQEIPRRFCNPKAHYRVHKGPALNLILSQMNPLHKPTPL
jgi:hypothetical protein